ncbi:site-specific integrase [Bradyrhizobium sp. 76]|uniref:tyrosine-type recombinase/integrase n=1 Tax=Bradyrhizobium sp. 76 TaxID=2782680 RepID=UPI001FF9F1E5|nr:site-specific integrase [Bradyrhizobium sp. 76]MCK1409547.1 tyrosine-type recombinase/integrase [Bradyrhizobium sp. 76]
MAKSLTAAAVNKFCKGAVRREIPDGGCQGLYLIIQPSGAKSWALRYRRPDKRPAKLVLGPVVELAKGATEEPPVIGGHLTLAGARSLVAKLQHQIAQGRDPAAIHFAEKDSARATFADRLKNTFDNSAREFIEQHARKKTRRWHEQARLLGFRPDDLLLIPNGLASRWAKRPVVEIDGFDIHSIVDETRHSGAPGLRRRSEAPTEARARAMFSVLSKMFRWLVQHRRLLQNPCVGVHRPDTPKSRDRVLSDPEIIVFWEAADAEPTVFAAPLKLLLLTGCRLNEVAGMQLSELNSDQSTWIIPGGRTKNGRAHSVPLSQFAQTILQGALEQRGSNELAFSTTNKSPVSGWSKVKRRLDHRMKVADWRLHDLRRTTATGMADIGIQPHIVEAALNHISGTKSGVAGVYNRALYAAEKKVALECWAKHVESIICGAANVVAFKRGRV